MAGKVYILGAGPGDPELLTLKAARILAMADVVLHDELVNLAILQHVRSGATIENVGKRSGSKHYPQNAINASMVLHARQGRCVARLKGGDPSLFGRLGEELGALRAANIDFEIVPGITAAVACAAEAAIPLTDRHAASSVMFLSGHTCAANVQPDWEAAVQSGSTIALYMPGDCALVAQRLIRAGMRGDIPCAIIANASLETERVFRAKLEQIGDTRIEGSPKLMIIGEVARVAEIRAAVQPQVDSIFEREMSLTYVSPLPSLTSV
ncbi:MAG: uroporphyrinogen-III C-methyltransferase [Bryobacteraceae bacterium]